MAIRLPEPRWGPWHVADSALVIWCTAASVQRPERPLAEVTLAFAPLGALWGPRNGLFLIGG
eukprot:8653934-Heterocapsa_arctica.AAC.1